MERLNPRRVVVLTIVLLVFGAVRMWTNPEIVSAAEEQALIVTLTLSPHGDTERIYALEDKLSAAIKKASAGEFDGDEFGKGTCTLYMYGPDAERLYGAVIQILKEYHPPKASYLVKRFGKPGAREQRIDFGHGR